MNKMVLTKWQECIIEWVNCINVCKNISRLEELKNGEFFTNIITELAHKDNATYTFNNVCEFLHKFFPLYTLESESTLPQELSDVELTNICSLLLYYCCMIDKRVDFISPLCDRVEATTQIYIKTFLEDLDCACEVTREVLQEAINNIHVYTVSPKFSTPLFGSPKVLKSTSNQTPLMEFFKTPIKKCQLNFESHKKEIQELLNQLDLERFERQDLQEELKTQYQKNKNLENKVKTKQDEISKLRSELFSLESRTPPKYTSNSNENKRLRNEIKSLEQYIENLHKEQEELQNERDTARTKLEKIEEQFNELQGKAVSSERVCNKLNEEKLEHLQEISTLRERCNELTTFMNEIRSQNPHDDSYEMDNSLCVPLLHNKSGAIDCESLAQTVVDLQLVDAQEENKSLRKQLTNLEDCINTLTEEIHQCQIRCDKILKENDEFHAENEELNKKVQILFDTQTQLEQTQTELKQSTLAITDLSEKNSLLNQTIAELHKKIQNSDLKLNESQLENSALLDELKMYTAQNTKLSDELEQLLSIKTDLDSKLHVSIKKALQFDVENSKLNLSLVKFEEDLKNCLIKLNNKIHNREIQDESFGFNKLEELINDLDSKNEYRKILEEKYAELSAELVQMNKINFDLTYDSEKLKDCLKLAQNKVDEFENVTKVNYDKSLNEYSKIIVEKDELITRLTTDFESKLKNKDDMIQVLNTEKFTLTEKQESLASQIKFEKDCNAAVTEQLNQLHDFLNERINYINDLEFEKTALVQKIVELRHLVEHERQFKEASQDEFLELRDFHTKKVQDYEILASEKRVLLEKLEKIDVELTKQTKLKEESERKEKHTQNTLKHRENIIANLKTQQSTLNEKYQELKQQIISNKKTIDDLNAENVRNEEIIDQKVAELQICLDEKIALQAKLKETELQLSNEIQSKNNYQTHYDDLKVIIKNNENKTYELQTTIDSLKQHISKLHESTVEDHRNYQEKETILQDKLSECELQLRNLIEDKNTLTENLAEITELLRCKIKNIKDLATEKLKLEEENQKLVTEINGLKLHQEQFGAQLIDTQNKLIQTKSKIQSLKNCNKELTKKCKDLNDGLNTKKQHLLTLESDNNELNVEIEALNSKIVELNTIITADRLQIEQLQQKHQEEIQNQDILIEKLKSNLQLLQTNINLLSLECFDRSDEVPLDEVLNHLKNNIATLKENLKYALLEKDEAIEEVTATKQEWKKYKEIYTELREAIAEDLSEILQNLSEQFNQYTNYKFSEYKALKKFGESLETQLSSDEQQSQVISSKLNELETKISELNDIKNRVYIEISDSQKQITILETCRNELQTNCDGLNIENNQLKCNLETFRTQIDNAQLLSTDLQSKLSELIQNHKLEIEEYDKKLLELQTQSVDLKETILKQQNNEKLLTDELLVVKNQLHQSIIDFKTSLDKEELNKTNYQSIIDKLKLELEKATNSFNEFITENVLKLKQHINKSETDENYLKSLNLLIENEENQNPNTLEQQIDYLLKERSVFYADIQIFQNSFDEFMNELNTRVIESNRAEILSNFEPRTVLFKFNPDSLQQLIETLQKREQNVQTIYENSISENELKIKDIIASYEGKLEVSEFKLNSLKLALNNYKQNLIDLKTYSNKFSENANSKITEKEIKIAKLETDINKLRENLLNINEDKKLLETKLNQVNANLEQYNEEKVNEVEKVQFKLKSVLNLLENLSKNLELQLENTNKNLSNAVMNLEQTSDMLKVENSYNDNLVVKIENEILNINQQIQSMSREKIDLEQNLSEIKTKLNDFECKRAEEIQENELKFEQTTKEHEERYETYKNAKETIINELENKLKDTNSELDGQKNEIANLLLKLKDSLDKIESIEQENLTLKQNYDQIMLDLTEIKSKRDGLIENIQQLREESQLNVEQSHKIVQKLENDFSKRFDAIQEDYMKEIKLNQQMNNFLTSEREQIKFLQQQIADITFEKNKTLEICNETTRNINKLHETIINSELLITKDGELEEDKLNQISNEFKQLLNKHEELKTDNVVTKQKLSDIELENSHLRSKSTELEAKLSDIKLENVNYQKTISEKEVLKHSISKENNKIKDKYEEELELMKAACSNWQKLIENHEIEYNKLKHEYAELKKHTTIEINTLKTSNCSLQNTMIQLEQKIITNEKIISQKTADHTKLNHKYLELKKFNTQLTTEQSHLQQKCDDYKKLIDEMQKDHQNLAKKYRILSEKFTESKGNNQELLTFQAAITQENTKLLADKELLTNSLMELNQIKDQYTKLLEENNKITYDLDTLRYKQRRDKEDYKKLIEEERTKASASSEIQLRDIRNEYEEKLKKMKDKIVKLYKDEMEKEKLKSVITQDDHIQAEETIASLKSQLWVTANRYTELKKEYERLNQQFQSIKKKPPFKQAEAFEVPRNDPRGSRESMYSLRDMGPPRNLDDRRMSTLPKDTKLPATVTEESVTFTRKTVQPNNLEHGLKMEDEEGELFNNTNLADLIAGRCEPSRDSRPSNRISELQYRNSMCLPHLKSSYPAETQFSSPGQFKEDDIKGNELHTRDVLREHTDNIRSTDVGKTGKTSTPSRLKALFSRSSTNRGGDNSEVGIIKKHPRTLQSPHSLVPFLQANTLNEYDLAEMTIPVHHIRHYDMSQYFFIFIFVSLATVLYFIDLV